MNEQKNETLLELRGMNWVENEKFELFKKSWLDAHKDEDKNSPKFFYACAAWVMDNVYKADKAKFTPGEVLAIFNATIVHSNSVRQDEIKNWPPSLTGTLKEAATAPTAEKSTSNEEQTQTAEAANTEDQK